MGRINMKTIIAINQINLKAILLLYLFLTVNWACAQENDKSLHTRQDKIIETYLNKGAWKYSYYAKEWQENIDKGIAEDSTIAYLWQQKAMPYFKQAKYEIAMPYLDKAVKYDPGQWLDYRAFMKCIFSKTYRDAIKDFESCISKSGNGIVMDHSYNFYIGLCHLQLNEFERAEAIFKKDIEYWSAKYNQEWIHHLDLFYWGVTLYELKKYKEAIDVFDKCLIKYPRFSDVKYYKSICLRYLDQKDMADKLYKEARKDFKDGYTINEDNTIYERYPYHVWWY